MRVALAVLLVGGSAWAQRPDIGLRRVQAAPVVTSAASDAFSDERVITAGTNVTLGTGTPGQLIINSAGGAGGGYTVMQEEGGDLTARTKLNFAGGVVTCVDDAINLVSKCTLVASGTGACGANTWASTLSNGAAPTCTQPAFSNLSGTATDAQLASNYSGVGACGANAWASTLNDNGAPTCTQPAFSNLSGTATDAQLASNYSGVGACAANSWASTLADNAAPTCTQPGFGNLSGTAIDSQLASAYSGAGACAANQWASTLSRNLAPTCTQPDFTNLSGTATNAQLPSSVTALKVLQAASFADSTVYAIGKAAPTSVAVSVCHDGTFATCSTFNVGNHTHTGDDGTGGQLNAGTVFGAGTLPVARGGTNVTSAAANTVLVGNGTTWVAKALPTCAAGYSAEWDATKSAWVCTQVAGMKVLARSGSLGALVNPLAPRCNAVRRLNCNP